ncbi:hypothetical protein ACU4GI_32705 [Cupriavidus basilensis]
MNFIKSLQQSNQIATARLAAYAEGIEGLRAHLLTPKFQGTDTDGSRKDWIAVGDVLRLLSEIERAATDAEPSEGA